MPDLETHCKISKIRTGEEFRELHVWMDEATKSLKHNHRLERHFFTQEYKDFIKEKWGGKAVVEWLFHIAIDNLETAHKFAVEEYNKAFEKITVEFSGKDVSSLKFIKKFPNSEKSIEIDLSTKTLKQKTGYTVQELQLLGFDNTEALQLGDDSPLND